MVEAKVPVVGRGGKTQRRRKWEQGTTAAAAAGQRTTAGNFFVSRRVERACGCAPEGEDADAHGDHLAPVAPRDVLLELEVPPAAAAVGALPRDARAAEAEGEAKLDEEERADLDVQEAVERGGLRRRPGRRCSWWQTRRRT